MPTLQEQAQAELMRRAALQELSRRQQEPNAPLVQGSQVASAPPGAIADPADVTTPQPKGRARQVYEYVQKALNPGPVQQMKAELGPMIGGTAGGIAGPLALGQIPPFTFLPEEAVTVPLTAALGAYAGGAGGKAVQQKYFEPGGVVSWPDAHKAGLWEAASELGGRAALGGIQALGNVLPIPNFAHRAKGPAQTILPEKQPGKVAKNAFQRSVKQMEDLGGVATPAQVDNRWWIHLSEGLARGSWVGTEEFEKVAARNESVLINMARDVVDDVADQSIQDATEAGEKLYSVISRNLPGGGKGTKIQQWHAMFDPVYAQVDELSEGAFVSTKSLKAFANEMLAKDDAAGSGLLAGSGRSAMYSIRRMEDEVPFDVMRGMRSKWLKQVRQLSKDMDTDTAIINKLAGLSDEAIFAAERAPGLSPEARTLLRAANKQYARYKSMMDDVFPFRMAEKLRTKPELVVREVFPSPSRTSGGAIRRIQSVQRALTQTPSGAADPEGQLLFDQLRQAWLAGMVSKNSEKGVLNTNMLRADLRRYGKNSLDILLPKKERTALENVLNVADATRRKGMMGGGALVAKSAQAGGAMLLYQGARQGEMFGVAAGGALAFGPIAYAKLATSPLGSKLLRASIPEFAGHKSVFPVTVRIARFLQAEGKKEEQLARRLQQRYRRAARAPQRIKQPSMKELRGFGGRGF